MTIIPEKELKELVDIRLAEAELKQNVEIAQLDFDLLIASLSGDIFSDTLGQIDKAKGLLSQHQKVQEDNLTRMSELKTKVKNFLLENSKVNRLISYSSNGRPPMLQFSIVGSELEIKGYN